MDYLTYLDRIKKLAKTTDGKLSFIYWLTEYDYINIPYLLTQSKGRNRKGDPPIITFKEWVDLKEETWSAHKEGLQFTGGFLTIDEKIGTLNNQLNTINYPVFKSNHEDKKYVLVIDNNGETTCYNIRPIYFKIMNWKSLPKKINKNGTGKENYLKLESVDRTYKTIYTYDKSEFITKTFNLDLERIIIQPEINKISESDFNNLCIEFKYIYKLTNGEIVFTKNKLKDEDAESIEYEIELNRIEWILEKLRYDDIVKGHIKKETIELLYYIKENVDGKYLTDEEYRNLISLSEKGLLNDKISNLLKVAIKNKTKFLDQYMRIIHYLYNQVILNHFEFNEDIYRTLHSMIEKDFKMPYKQIEYLINKNQLKTFLENSNFDIYHKYFPNDRDFFIDEAERGWINFANNLGCFSKEKVKDENGNETEELLAEKACKFLMEIINRKDINFMDFCYMQIDLEPNQKFLDFISKKFSQDVLIEDENNKTKSTYYNLENLINAQKRYPFIFPILMEKFNELQKGTDNLSEDFLKDFYHNNPFLGTNDDNREFAIKMYDLIGVGRGHSAYCSDHKYFVHMNDAIQYAKTHKMPNHLAGVPLHGGSNIFENIDKIFEEKTTLDDIKEIREQVKRIIKKKKI